MLRSCPRLLQHQLHHGSLSLSRWNWLFNTCGKRWEDTAGEQKQRGKTRTREKNGVLNLLHSLCMVWDICGGIKPSGCALVCCWFSWLTAVAIPWWYIIIILECVVIILLTSVGLPSEVSIIPWCLNEFSLVINLFIHYLFYFFNIYALPYSWLFISVSYSIEIKLSL